VPSRLNFFGYNPQLPTLQNCDTSTQKAVDKSSFEAGGAKKLYKKFALEVRKHREKVNYG
jgi:hypothetical protein